MDDEQLNKSLRLLEPDEQPPEEDTVKPSREALWRPIFIKVLAGTGNVRAACQAVGITRTQAFRARDRSPAFRQKWDEAQADAADVLEALALKRAREGSDTMLMFLLRGAKPEKYRDNYKPEWKGHLTVSGPNGGPIKHKHSADEELDQRAELLALMEQVGMIPSPQREYIDALPGEDYEVMDGQERVEAGTAG